MDSLRYWVLDMHVDGYRDAMLAPGTPYVVEDLLDGAEYVWRDDWNYVKLDPAARVAHILVVRG